MGTRPNISPTFVMSSEETPAPKIEEVASTGEAEINCTPSRGQSRDSLGLDEDFVTSSDGESSLHHILHCSQDTE